ncbi:MAG TPA: hypothetical protein VF546_01390 [Pyrinomonadaceae bacterium]|jgi:hypothetical protein
MKNTKPKARGKPAAARPARVGQEETGGGEQVRETPPRAARGPAADRLRVWARGLDWSVIKLVLAAKFLIIVLGGVAFEVWQNKPLEPSLGWLKVWNRWDAVQYQSLAQNGYQAAGDARFLIVFFPLYPLLTRLVAFVARDYILSAFIVSGVASVAAVVLLKRLTELDETETLARRAAWFLVIFPTSYFLHVGYTESLFLALVLGCLLAGRGGRWHLAGALSVLAALCRVNGLILCPVLLVEAWQEYRAARRWRWQWAWAAGALVGFAGYLWLNYHVTGQAFTFMTYQREHWYRNLAPPWAGLRSAFNGMWGAPENAHMVGFEEFFFALLGLGATVASARLLRLSYTVWMALNWLLFTSTSFMLSVPRYTLTLFPVFILFARLSRRPFWYEALTIWSLLFLALFAGLFANGHWAF